MPDRMRRATRCHGRATAACPEVWCATDCGSVDFVHHRGLAK
ncbi:hypothetical protein NSERUTF1_1767 [Nocardia seriolae]|nr:hypothetical protein NSERUTF1_1767 [Nocardia seriolae]